MTPSEPTEGAPRPVVDTARPAEALNVTPDRLERWAHAGIVTPHHVDPDGDRWWDIRDLRHQVATYLDDHDKDT